MSQATAEAERPAVPPDTEQDDQKLPESQFVDEDGKLRIVIVGLGNNIEAHANDAARNRLKERLNEKGVKRILNAIWYGGPLRRVHLSRFKSQAKEEIVTNNNLLHHRGLSDEENRVATTLRFADEYDTSLHEGEKRGEIFDRNDDGTENVEGQRIKTYIVDLIQLYASGKIASEDDFNEAKKRVLTEMVEKGKVSQEYVEEHLGDLTLYTDNLLQIAQYVKVRAEHEDLDAILGNMDIVLGNARMGVRSEHEPTSVERITKKLEEKLAGKTFLNEATIAVAVASVFSIAGWAGKSTVGALTRAIAPGVASGLWAGMREAQMLKEERAQHAREMAAGSDPNTVTGLQAELETTRYEAKSATNLIMQIEVLYDEHGELRQLDGNEFREAMQMVAECKARIRLSDLEKIDLISFSAVDKVDSERWNLDKAIAKIEVALRSRLAELSEAQLKIGRPDVEADLEHPDEIYADLMEEFSEANEGLLQGDMEVRDRVYKKLRNKKVAAAFLKGTILGTSIGLVVQEAHALISDNQQGFVEGMMGHHTNAPNQTTLEHLTHLGQAEQLQRVDALHIDYQDAISIGKDGNILAPEGFQIEQHGNILTIIEPNGTRISNISLTADGHLTPEGASILKAAHLNVSEDVNFVTHEVTHESKVSAEQFVKDNKTVNVSRDFWYDNGTQNVYDGSELGLQWPQVDVHGNIHVSVAGMDVPSTSSTGAVTNWHELAAGGHLKVALSVSDGTQSHVFMFDIDQNGQAIIPKDSPAAQLFETHHGQVTPHYRFMEVVQSVGKDQNNVEHIRPLATAIGPGQTNLTEQVTINQTQPVSTYTITPTPQAPAAPVAVHAPNGGGGRPFVVLPFGMGTRRREPQSPSQPQALPQPDSVIISEIPEAGGAQSMEPEDAPELLGAATPRLGSRLNQPVNARIPREGSRGTGPEKNKANSAQQPKAPEAPKPAPPKVENEQTNSRANKNEEGAEPVQQNTQSEPAPERPQQPPTSNQQPPRVETSEPAPQPKPEPEPQPTPRPQPEKKEQEPGPAPFVFTPSESFKNNPEDAGVIETEAARLLTEARTYVVRARPDVDPDSKAFARAVYKLIHQDKGPAEYQKIYNGAMFLYNQESKIGGGGAKAEAYGEVPPYEFTAPSADLQDVIAKLRAGQAVDRQQMEAVYSREAARMKDDAIRQAQASHAQTQEQTHEQWMIEVFEIARAAVKHGRERYVPTLKDPYVEAPYDKIYKLATIEIALERRRQVF